MKHAIYILTVVTLLAAFAPAQEKDLVTRLRELAPKILSDDPAVRENAIEELQRLAAPRAGARLVIGAGTQDEQVIQLETDFRSEKIMGSWKTNGTKGNYTLESLGKGRYKLQAKSVDAEGNESTYSDEGRMNELRKKYTFLKNFGTISIIGTGVPEGAPTLVAWTTSAPRGPSPNLIKNLGIFVRRPSAELEFHLKLPTETTWIVESVPPGTVGGTLGLKRYDLITGADGKDLADLGTLQKAKKSLAIVRRSKPMRIALEPAKDK